MKDLGDFLFHFEKARRCMWPNRRVPIATPFGQRDAARLKGGARLGYPVGKGAGRNIRHRDLPRARGFGPFSRLVVNITAARTS
mgnify:CR=1 FL=1